MEKVLIFSIFGLFIAFSLVKCQEGHPVDTGIGVSTDAVVQHLGCQWLVSSEFTRNSSDPGYFIRLGLLTKSIHFLDEQVPIEEILGVYQDFYGELNVSIAQLNDLIVYQVSSRKSDDQNFYYGYEITNGTSSISLKGIDQDEFSLFAKNCIPGGLDWKTLPEK